MFLKRINLGLGLDIHLGLGLGMNLFFKVWDRLKTNISKTTFYWWIQTWNLCNQKQMLTPIHIHNALGKRNLQEGNSIQLPLFST